MEELSEAREAFRAFAAGIDRNARIVILHDSDADGVTAGIVLQAALERTGCTRVSRLIPNRERDAWSPANRALVREAAPDALFVLDLGSRDEPLTDAPSCFIDHHRPEGVPPGALLISGYAWDPIPNTSLLVYDVCAAIADVSDLDWVAAIGLLSDLGEKASFPLVERVRKRYAMKDLKELTTLVNAARRASDYAPERAARFLRQHPSPREALTSESEDLLALREAREEVRRELANAKKAAPKFAGNVALVRIASRCQVHPVIAQIWRTRLPAYIVIVANEAYLPGRVNFSMRSGSGVNLLEFLGGIDLGEGEGSYARGHDQATGGSLPYARWNLLLEKLGFAAEFRVADGMQDVAREGADGAL
jgi:single-stranded DNA-specific DHH superfamily exonuclease